MTRKRFVLWCLVFCLSLKMSSEMSGKCNSTSKLFKKNCYFYMPCKVLESHGNTTEPPGKSWKTTSDLLYESWLQWLLLICRCFTTHTWLKRKHSDCANLHQGWWRSSSCHTAFLRRPWIQGQPWKVLEFRKLKKALNCFGKRLEGLEKFGICLSWKFQQDLVTMWTAVVAVKLVEELLRPFY